MGSVESTPRQKMSNRGAAASEWASDTDNECLIATQGGNDFVLVELGRRD